MKRVVHSAGGIVLNPRGEVLVVNQNNNSWSLPKGHLDPGESERQAAEREIYEESGVKQLEFIQALGSYERSRIGLHGGEDAAQVKRITLFLYRTQQMELKPLDPRNPEARWVPKGSVVKMLTHPKDREFFLQCLKVIP